MFGGSQGGITFSKFVAIEFEEMESVNLHELSRKELKQLCNEHNIRTAGVKHDDLVRLLRNKMYPPASDPPRLSKARSQASTDIQVSPKSTSEVAEKTLRRSTSQGRSRRSLVFADDSSRDNTPERSTRELSPSAVLPQKSVLAKSNSTPARRSDFLRKKVNTLSGLGKQSQERRPQQGDGSSDKSRSNSDSQRPSIRNTSMAVKRLGDHPVVKINETKKSQKNADAYSEPTSSPRASEGDASVTAMDSSDVGSHSFCSVSEVATDAGNYAMSEDSDNEDGRSVSSEPASRFTSQINKLTPRRNTGSKLGQGAHSSWHSEQGSDPLDPLARSNGVHGQDSNPSATHNGEEIFSYLLGDADSLVVDTDGPDSFLDAYIADPEDVNRADGHQVDLEQFRTPEMISTAHCQEDDNIDREGSMGEEVTTIYNNKAALTADHPEFALGDCLLEDHDAAPISEMEGVVHTSAAELPSTPEARTEILNAESSNDSALVEKPNADNDTAPQFPQNPNHSSDHESAIALVSSPDSGRSAERVEVVSESAPDILNHLNKAAEFSEHPPVHFTIEEPENVSGIELCDSLSSSGKEELGAASVVLSDPVHMEEQDCESRDLENNCNRVSEDGVADGQSPRNNEDLTEMLMTAREASEHTQSPASALRLLSDDNNDAANHGSSEDGTPVRDASDYVPEDIQHANLTPAELDENRSDVNWSFVSALYDDLEGVHNTVDLDSYGLLEHKLAEASETGDNLTEDVEPLQHLRGPENETGNHVEPATVEVLRSRVEDKGNVETASSSLVGVTEGLDPSPNEVASKSNDHEEVGTILQNGATGIAFDSHPPGMYATSGEATLDEGTGSIPLDFDSSRFSNVPKESDVVFNVSEHNIQPFSVDKDGAEETVTPDDLLRSSADDVSGANSSVSAEGKRSRSFNLVQETLEGLREENTSETSTEMEEETETWSACEGEDLGVHIQTLAIAVETQNSTGLREHESRPSSSEHQDGVVLHGDKHSLGLKHLPGLVPDKLEKTSDDNAAAAPRPRKMEQILSVGLKIIFVIGSITFGILKFRGSRLRLGRSS